MAAHSKELQAYREVVDVVRGLNTRRDRDPIPVAADLGPLLDQAFYRDRGRLQSVLDMLAESRHLIAFRLVEADPRMQVEAVMGYIVAEAEVVRELKAFIFERLEVAYERQFYRRRTAALIIQEMMQDIRKYNNSQIGRMLNAAVMLQQYDQLMGRGGHDYLPAAKEARLKELLQARDSERGESAAAGAEASSGAGDPPKGDPRRATDTPSGLEAERMDLSGDWGRAVEKFGVEFLLRIHFRKNEFNKIKYLVNTRRVARESDLIFVRDTVRTLQSRALEKQDPELRRHITALQNLLSSVHVKLQMIALERERE